MIKPVKFTILCLFLFAPMLVRQTIYHLPAHAQSVSPYRYTYVYQVPPRGNIVIKTVDPVHPTGSELLLTTAFPDNAALYGALTSPDGEWIVLIPDENGQFLQLIEVATGQTRDVEAILGLSHDFTGTALLGQLQVISWSPDSQLLAFAALATNQFDVFVYDLADDTLTNLSNDSALQQAIAWSPDSRYLASGGLVCNEADCHAQVDVLDWSTQTHVVSQNVAPANQMSYEGSVCQFRWSPDAHYLSFVSSCDVSMQGMEKELFLLDRTQRTVSQLTHYTQTAIQAPNAPGDFPLRWGIYDTGWLDANTFFLGETFAQTELSNITSQTVHYDVSTGSETILRADVMAEAWTLNGFHNQFAFRTASGYPNGRIYHAVEIASVEAGALSTIASGPAGCDLTWSPDGAVLAYTGHVANCYTPVRTLYFMETVTGQLSSYPLAESGDVRPAGWIKNLH